MGSTVSLPLLRAPHIPGSGYDDVGKGQLGAVSQFGSTVAIEWIAA